MSKLHHSRPKSVFTFFSLSFLSFLSTCCFCYLLEFTENVVFFALKSMVTAKLKIVASGAGAFLYVCILVVPSANQQSLPHFSWTTLGVCKSKYERFVRCFQSYLHWLNGRGGIKRSLVKIRLSIQMLHVLQSGEGSLTSFEFVSYENFS